MILNSLVDYYEALAKRGELSRPGWGIVKVSYALELDRDGTLIRVLPLLSPSADGKKQLPRPMELPAPIKRTTDKKPNFLWDNSTYLLGFDGKGKTESEKARSAARAKECLNAAREFHLARLRDVSDPFALAVYRYFERATDAFSCDDPLFSDVLEGILAGGNLVFLFEGTFPSDNAALHRVWQAHYDGESAEPDAKECMRCLVTGETTVPQKVHPSIKSVKGAQSSGAALISFNAQAFWSFGREQSVNAPVGKYAAFAYTTALNHLLADRNHVRCFGDATVVCWAEDAEPAYQSAMDCFFDGGGDTITNEELMSCLDAIARGVPYNWNGVHLEPTNRFFILGLAPNAARLSVRFFLRDNFGTFAENIKRHYDDIDIVTDNRSTGLIPLWRLLRETVNMKATDKSPSPQMTGDTLRAILTGGAYPATLFQQTQLRIRAERDVTRGRMAIVKGYLTRQPNNSEYREALTVQLNETTDYQPYILGRLFSVLEAIQQAANPSINATIKDKYFSSVCATPAVVFPTLINLAQSHLAKMDVGKRVYYSKQLNALTGRITETYPAHHTLAEQGIFQLGYYHETQKRYEKKDKTAAAGINKEDN